MKIRAPGPGRRALPALGLIALGAFFVARAPAALLSSWQKLTEASVAVHDGAEAALVRQRGPDYAAAIARIRGALPEDAEYLLFDVSAGVDMIVKFDLAPRRAVFGGRLPDFAPNVTPALLETLPKWAVIPSLDPPGPRLVETRLLAGKGALP